MQAAAQRAQRDGGVVDWVASRIQQLAAGVQAMQTDFEGLANSTSAPGPLAETLLDVVRKQSQAAAATINAAVNATLTDLPALDPARWAPQAEAAIDRLLDQLDAQAGSTAAVGLPPLADQVALALPDAVNVATSAIEAAGKAAGGLVADAVMGVGDDGRLPLPGAVASSRLMQRLGIGVEAARARLASAPLRRVAEVLTGLLQPAPGAAGPPLAPLLPAELKAALDTARKAAVDAFAAAAAEGGGWRAAPVFNGRMGVLREALARVQGEFDRLGGGGGGEGVAGRVMQAKERLAAAAAALPPPPAVV